MCVKGRKGKKVDPATYAEIFEVSEPWPEVANWRRYEWRLVRNVPLHELEFSTLEEYNAAAETDPEEEAWENIDRVEAVISLLRSGKPLWPVILGLDCMVLDGYHRMSAANELGIKEIDVLYPVLKRGDR